MTPSELVAELRRRGATLEVDGDRLRWSAPAGTVTRDLLAELRDHKPAVLALLAAETDLYRLVRRITELRRAAETDLYGATEAARRQRAEADALLDREGWPALERYVEVGGEFIECPAGAGAA